MTVKTALARIQASLKQVQWLRVANRIVAAATLLSGYTTLLHLIPGETGIIATTALGLIASQGPRVLKAAGIFNPVQPGELTVYQTILQTANAFVAARKAQKAQTKTQATLDELTPLVPLLAPLMAAELNKSRDLNPQTLAAGIAAKKAALEAQATAAPEAAVETAPPAPEAAVETAPPAPEADAVETVAPVQGTTTPVLETAPA